MFKRIGIAIGSMFIAGFALAGVWNTQYPIVGGSSYCGSTVNGSCVSTITAGPTAVTGAETIPLDTNLAQGQNPQTAIVTTLTLANYARGTGLLYTNSTPTAGATGTSEQTIMTYSVPASTLVSGRRLKIKASFSAAANGNNKTWKCYFGASVISSGVLTTNAKNGDCELNVGWLTASTQTVWGKMLVDTTAITGYVAAGTDTTSAAVVAKVTVTGGTTGADLTVNDFWVEVLGK